MAPKERRQPKRASVATPTVSLDFIQRRITRHLKDLERANYTEPTGSANPYAVAAPGAEGSDEETKQVSVGGRGSKRGGDASYDESGSSNKKRKKSSTNVRTLLMYRKTLEQLVDEAKFTPNAANYVTAVAPPSAYPKLELCSVCGYKGNYACTRCGLKYCDLGCRGVHDETRCERR